MTRSISALLLCSTALCAQGLGPGVRILFGVTDQAPTRWDGSVTARDAQINSIEGWRFEAADSIEGTSWKASTRIARLFGNGGQFGIQGAVPVVPNGVIIRFTATNPAAELTVTTPHGSFPVRIAGLKLGSTATLLDGRVSVELLPPVTRLTKDPDEQDYPATATAKDGTIWLAYANFKHHPDHDKLRANLKSAPKDFSAYLAPTGGDQIVTRSYRDGNWSAPIAITSGPGDLQRPAIAVNGKGSIWVFWPENQKGNFDIWARRIMDGVPGRPVRISSEPGTDMDPVAATDASGKVWVAWQGWRNGRAQILLSEENGEGFTSPKAVSPANGNQWDPAIAADRRGRVTVAWDSYENGNYDIFARTVDGSGAWGSTFPVAATARYEAYPSVTYDPMGRLWIAYEEGGEGWGKDFGAQSSVGIALYQGRAIRLRGFDRTGRAITTRVDPASVLPGPMSIKGDARRQAFSDSWLVPDPALVGKRPPSRSTDNLWAPKNSMPRLLSDASGRLWLAFRSVHPVWWTPLGTVWTEHAISYDGYTWSDPILLDHSDNLLDNRPALASNQPGEVFIIGSSDGRRDMSLAQRHAPAGDNTPNAVPVVDPFNNDLWVNQIKLPAARSTQVVAAAQPAVAGLSSAGAVERDVIANIRKYRLQAGPRTLRIARGEFHRHSEVSMDGGFDGTILDQWRYAIDAADLDWVGCCDHDNGGGREYTWWTTQKQTDLFYNPGRFSPLFSYERSVAYPEGHRNVLFAQRGVRTLPRLPKMANESTGRAPDTQMLYRYLKDLKGVTASHTSATNMGTDWRDNDPLTETSVEIYQGDRQNYEKPGAPRSSEEKDSIGGYRPKGYIDLALEMGYKMAFEASSDHVSTHMSFSNVLTTGLTREELMDAFRKRHVYASTDNILAEFRSGSYIMGDAFTTTQTPAFQVKLAGTAPFSKVVIVKNNQYVYSIEPKTATVAFTWRDEHPDKGKVSYYYVRGEQSNGELVWASPMWVTYSGK